MRNKRLVCAVMTALTFAEAAPALAVDALEGEKPRHKVKESHELDADAPKDAGGKVQVIPTPKAAKQLRAEKRHERLAAKAEKRQQRTREHARLHGAKHGGHGMAKAHKVHGHKARKVKIHRVHVRKAHAAKHAGGQKHGGHKRGNHKHK